MMRDAGSLRQALPSPTTFPRALGGAAMPLLCWRLPTPLSDNIRGRSVIFPYFFFFFFIVVISSWWWDLQAAQGLEAPYKRGGGHTVTEPGALPSALRLEPPAGLACLHRWFVLLFGMADLQWPSKAPGWNFRSCLEGCRSNVPKSPCTSELRGRGTPSPTSLGHIGS